MIGFVLSLLLLSVMFSLLSGLALAYRKLFLRGREGMMYPVWILILTVSVLPLRFNFLSVLPSAPPGVSLEENQTDTDSDRSDYQGDYSELDLASQLYDGQSNQTAVKTDTSILSLLLIKARLLLLRFFSKLELITTAVFTLWIFGAAISFARSITDYFTTQRLLLACSADCQDDRLRAMLTSCKQKFRLRRKVRLRIFSEEALSSPCVSGCLSPVIYLDPGCARLPDRELTYVLSHELNHIHRHDMFIKLFSLFVAAVHWLNPIGRRVLHAMHEDCELACDSGVIRLYGREITTLYMSTILDFAERFSENSRLLGAQTLSGGLFITHPSGAVFLKRRYANMKNNKKNHLTTVATAVFAAVCITANVAALSSCTALNAESAGALIDINLSAPVEQMIRAYYGLSNDDFISADMLEGITSLKITKNTLYDPYTLADFVVNGEDGYTQALPKRSLKNYWETVVLPAIDIGNEKHNEAIRSDDDPNNDGKIDILIKKATAFFMLRDPKAPELTETNVKDLYAILPELEQKGAIYYFDPYASDRELMQMYSIFDQSGLLDAWEVDSTAFDLSQFAYFLNLESIELVGFTPLNAQALGDVMITVTQPSESVVVNSDSSIRVQNASSGTKREQSSYTDENGVVIFDPPSYDYDQPTDGSTVTIPINASLEAALREYFVMENWDFEKTPLTSKHLERITSITAETDDAMTAILRSFDNPSSPIFANAEYVRYTINGFKFDIIPTYYNKTDFENLFSGVVTDDLMNLLKSAYTYSSKFGCYVLNDTVRESDKLAIFKGMAEIALTKVELVGSDHRDAAGSGAYRTNFKNGSENIVGIAPRFLDAASQFDQADRTLFPNLESWDIQF